MVKKKLQKKYGFVSFILLTLFLLGIGAWYGYTHQLFQDRMAILSACTGHETEIRHYHTYLEIIQDGKKIPIPKNIGIIDTCFHTVHTHDSTGIIHTNYPQLIDITLGDFFDMQGIIFNDKQIGSLKAFDGYTITVKVEGKLIKDNYRSVIFKDRGHISIIITYHKK